MCIIQLGTNNYNKRRSQDENFDFSHSKYIIFRDNPNAPDFSRHIYSKSACSTLSTKMMFFLGALGT